MEETIVNIEKSEIIKLLRLEQNYLKDSYIKNKNENKDINDSKSYDDLVNSFNKLSENNKENLKEISKNLSKVSHILTFFCLFMAGYNLANKDMFWFYVNLFLSLLCSYMYLVYKMIGELANEEKEELDGSYSISTKINNIDNAIDFLQGLTKKNKPNI